MQSSDLLAGLPKPFEVSAAEVASSVPSEVVYVVLDDDPTGTQSVAGLPVLTRWSPDDFSWALQQGTAAVYVLTNTRSLDAEQTVSRTRAVVAAATEAAAKAGRVVRFVSRGDSTLRGHYPLETDILSQAMLDGGGVAPSFTVLIPAFPDAGRITVHGVHYWVVGDEATPVGQTPFAADATFGFTSSSLADWVAEKTGGRIAADQVVLIDIETVRKGPDAVAAVLREAPAGSVVAPDVVAEDDMRVIALAIHALEAEGRSALLRIGPPYLRAHIGQPVAEPVLPDQIEFAHDRGGLVVVGSHVPLTTAQLAHLKAARPDTVTIELNARLLLTDERNAHLDDRVRASVDSIAHATVIVHTSRELIRGRDEAHSLDIARQISSALVDFVARLLDAAPPRFVVAKGGITSSDTASEALGISRAMVVGPMLPGIVSLWQPQSGPAQGIPYVVFAGNVGEEDSLTAVVARLAD